LRSKLAPHPVCRSNVLGNPPLRGLYGAPLTVLHLVRRDEGFSAHGLHDSQVPLAPVACVSRDLFRPSSRVGFTLDQERRKMRRISRLIGQVRSHHDLAAGIYEHLGVVSLNKALVGAFHDPRFRVCKVPLGSRLRLGFGRILSGVVRFPCSLSLHAPRFLLSPSLLPSLFFELRHRLPNGFESLRTRPQMFGQLVASAVPAVLLILLRIDSVALS